MSNKKKWWFTSPSRNCLPAVSSPLCALFVARPTSAVENTSRYMTFRQVHRSGEHWNFLIIVFIAAEPCKFGTAPAPSRENYPGSGSGSGSEQNVPAAPAPAPVPDKVCRFRRLRLRIPATLLSRNCLQQCPPSVPSSWPSQHLSDTVRRITAPVSIGIS